MITLIRQWSKPLLWVLVVVVVLSFSLWGTYSNHPGETMNRAAVARIEGRAVTAPQFQKAMGNARFMQMLRMGREFPDSDEVRRYLQSQAWQQLLLRHEARRLGVDVPDADLASIIHRHPMFTDAQGAFDARQYQTFVERTLPAMGMTEAGFEEALKEEVKRERVIAVLTAGASVPDAEARDLAVRLHAPTDIEVFEFKETGFAASVAPADDEVRKAYEAGADKYSEPPARRVRYVRFEPESGAADAKAARQKAGEAALAFAVKLQETDGAGRADAFAKLAAERGLRVEESGFFAMREGLPGMTNSLAAARAAFQLAPEQPDSDPVEAGGGFLVMLLAESRGAQPMPFEKARKEVEADLRRERAADAASVAASTGREKLAEALAAGKDPAAAFKELGLKPVVRKGVTLAEQPEAADDTERVVRGLALQTATGQVSQVYPGPDGPMFIRVAARGRDPVADADLRRARQRLLVEAREMVLREWLLSAMRRKGTEFQLARQGQEPM